MEPSPRIDLHCHVLPGVDDGPDTEEQSIELCRVLVNEGIQIVVATPHMQDGCYCVSPETAYSKVQKLQKKFKILVFH